ncbi:unnamed protein product [Symbiodinium necroappetens]|uniref:Uncharacterized protein n=1 Tax=Symbiodinium necroappetens TaxID=1628268 RepID=A0A812WDL7_9DINO|nr:unnamed protein product [Symbiodinium necroappetens]
MAPLAPGSVLVATASAPCQQPAQQLARSPLPHPRSQSLLTPILASTAGLFCSLASMPRQRLRRRASKEIAAGQSSDGELAGGSYELMKTSGVEWTMMFKAADDFARKNGLRKLGDSETAASKMAAFYPSDEAFPGVRDWLDARGLRPHFPAVNQWCKEMGAEDIIDLIENTEEIAEFLGDALNENERADLCGRRFSEGRTSCHPKLANHFKHPKAAMERRRPGVLIAAAGAFLVALLRSSSAFLAPAAGSKPDAAEGALRRRDMLATLGVAAAWQADEAFALRDARFDSICSYKCLAICNERAPGNEEYCNKLCVNYCQQSKEEKDLNSQVKKGSIVDKILEKSRKKKFDNNRADNAKTEQLDQWLGSQIALTNETDYANGIKETGRIRELFKPERRQAD